MSDSNQPTNADKRREEKPATVEMRSDAMTLHGKNKMRELQGKKGLAILGGSILVLLLIGLGVYAALRPASDSSNDGSSDNKSGVFKELPLGGDGKTRNSKVSGLSGVACDHPNRRPIGVMLAGDVIVRPVSGFAQADMVWELPVLESGVTRLMAVYQCGEPADIGSIRSARHDYLFLAEGVDAILAHWGGSYHALNRINEGEFDTINALNNPYGAFYRKPKIRRPNNGFSSYDRLWNALQKLGYRTETTFEGYDFKDDIAENERPSGGTLSVAWPGNYRVRYEYDPEANRYQRYWAGVKQVDGVDGTPIAPSSVVIMRAANGAMKGAGGYNDVDIEGEGALVVYQDGTKITGTWRKDVRYKNDPVHFMNENGDPIRLTKGQVWIMAVDPAISVTWEPVQGEQGAGQPAS